jgi:hypothetical protein
MCGEVLVNPSPPLVDHHVSAACVRVSMLLLLLLLLLLLPRMPLPRLSSHPFPHTPAV